MRQFYLGKNSNGYYRVYFIDPVTGVRDTGKSTHTKDKIEATLIAGRWLKEGVPFARSHSRLFLSGENSSCQLNLKNIVEILSEAQADELIKLLSVKFNKSFDSALVEVPVTSEASVSVPVPENITPVKPKKVIVVKKTATVKNTGANSGASCVPSVPAEKVEKEGAFSGASSVPGVPNEKGEYLNAEGKHLLCATLDNFWDYDNSEFIRRTLAHGRTMTRKYTFCMRSFVRNYWRPYFGDEKCIEDLMLAELDDFFFDLRDQKELSNETVNKNINMANRCFKNMFKLRKIDFNPLEGIERFASDNEERGIPTEQEVRDLLNLEWDNYTAKLAFKVAAFYGLRAGEISGLRVCDVDPVADMLHVRHSWSEMDKLKSTKNKDTRDLPIEHSLALQLLSLARQNPNYGDLSYIFYAPHNPAEPFYPGYYGDCFYKAMDQIGIHEEERKDRNIVFHSLRHFCCTILKQRADIETVKLIMGHKSTKMTEHYSDHETQEKFDNMRVIMSDAWSKYETA